MHMNEIRFKCVMSYRWTNLMVPHAVCFQIIWLTAQLTKGNKQHSEFNWELILNYEERHNSFTFKSAIKDDMSNKKS
jgi:hypothetical protein